MKWLILYSISKEKKCKRFLKFWISDHLCFIYICVGGWRVFYGLVVYFRLMIAVAFTLPTDVCKCLGLKLKKSVVANE